jgi:hypothetical protein
LYTHIYILFACFLGLTPFSQVFCAFILIFIFFCLHFGSNTLLAGFFFTFVDPRKHSICLLLGSNSLLAGVLRFYTHIYILFACFLCLTPFLQVFLRLYTDVYILFACFLGLTPFLQVFCASIPIYTFYLLDFFV